MPNRYAEYALKNPRRYNHLNQYADDPYSDNYNNRYYNPDFIFSGIDAPDYIEGGLTDPRHRDLAETFARIRDLDNGDYPFTNNAAALKMNGFNPKPIITSDFSNYFIFDGSNPRAHSERIVFRDALTNLINQYDDNREIQSPHEYALEYLVDRQRVKDRDGLSREDKQLIEQEALNSVSGYETPENLEQFNKYRDLLRTGNHIVNLWTERPPCNGAQDCRDFLSRILPENSEVGYITQYNGDTLPSRTAVKNASLSLRQAYQNYMNTRQAANGRDYFSGDDEIFDEINLDYPVEVWNPLRAPDNSPSRVPSPSRNGSPRSLSPFSSSSDDSTLTDSRLRSIFDINSSSSSYSSDDTSTSSPSYYESSSSSDMDTGSDSDYDANTYRGFRSPWPGGGYVPGKGYF